jgi:hypothetical protein
VQRTVPFGLLCASLVVCWYTTQGQPALDVAAHRALSPWYRHKHAVSFADMLTAPTCSPRSSAPSSRPNID